MAKDQKVLDSALLKLKNKKGKGGKKRTGAHTTGEKRAFVSKVRDTVKEETLLKENGHSDQVIKVEEMGNSRFPVDEDVKPSNDDANVCSLLFHLLFGCAEISCS